MACVRAIPLFVFSGDSIMAGRFHYGGQALIEGVMMRGQKNLATALRLPDGQLETTHKPIPSIYTGRFRKAPFFRGILVLLETLIIGTQALLYSAERASAGEEGQELPRAALILAVVVSLSLGIALFFVTPHLILRSFDPYIASDLVSNVLEGIVRVLIFATYVALIGLMPDVRRVFAYHGAEHRVINAYEAGIPLTPAAVQSYSTSHARCGTSFIFVVLVVSIVVLALLGRPPILIGILSRLLLLPLIAAASYEIIKWSADRQNSFVVRLLTLPGLLLQKLVTRQPDEAQIETAIAALKLVLQEQDTPATTVPEPSPITGTT